MKRNNLFGDVAGIAFVFAMLFILASVFVPNFFTIKNFAGLALSVSMVGMVACTMLFVLASKELDLSAESVVALAGVLAAVVMRETSSVKLGIAAGVLAGGAVGVFNGIAVSKFKINALIATLATMMIVRGLGFIVSDGKAVGIVQEGFFKLGNSSLLRVPTPVFITAVCFIVSVFLLRNTVFGKNILAIGGNEEASRLAGINVDNIKIAAFALQGLMAGFAGVILASRFTSGQPNTSQGFSLQVISACVLGGVSLTGGTGSVLGVIVGVLILGTVENTMSLLNVPVFYQKVVYGATLLGAVLFDQYKHRQTLRTADAAGPSRLWLRTAAVAIIGAVVIFGLVTRFKHHGTPAQEKVKIGFLVKMPEEMWFQNETQYAKECAADYGFHLIAIGTPDGEKVLTAIDSLAANGAKGFVICTPDVRLGPAIYSRALLHDMKVLAVDDQFVAADGTFMQEVPFMGCAAWDIGRTVAKELYKEFKNRAWNIEETAACGITFDELDCVKQRTDATVSTLLELGFPQDRIYRIGEKTTDIPGAFDVANIVLAQHPEVKRWLVFSVNDEGVLGAVRAMEGRGFDADSVIGIGIGAGVGFTEFEKQKPTGFFGTVVMNNRRHGYETTELLYKWVTQGRQPPSQTKTPGFMTTRDTYKQVMKELGMGNLVQ